MSIRHCFLSMQFRRETCMKLSLFLLLGSLFGALCAKWVIQSENVPLAALSPDTWEPCSLVRSLLRSAVFPSLMSAALVLRSRGVFSLLFLAKGFFFSYLLCVLTISGSEVGHPFFMRLLTETVLPLPTLLYVGTVWSEDTRRGSSHLVLLLICAVVCFFSVFLASILF